MQFYGLVWIHFIIFGRIIHCLYRMDILPILPAYKAMQKMAIWKRKENTPNGSIFEESVCSCDCLIMSAMSPYQSMWWLRHTNINSYIKTALPVKRPILIIWKSVVFYNIRPSYSVEHIWKDWKLRTRKNSTPSLFSRSCFILNFY